MPTKNLKIPRIPVLNYHHVHDGEPYFRVTPSTLRSQMEWLLSQDYITIHPHRLIKLKNTASITEKFILVTFDDGYLDFSQNAWPILREMGIPTTLFLISNYIGGWNDWDRPCPSKYRHMDIHQLKVLQDQGLVLGSHSCSHRQLTSLDREELLVEIRDSKLVLEGIFNTKISTFAYPGGHVNQAVRDAVAQYYDLGFTVYIEAHGSTCDPYMIERFDPSFCRDLEEFSTYLQNIRRLKP